MSRVSFFVLAAACAMIVAAAASVRVPGASRAGAAGTADADLAAPTDPTAAASRPASGPATAPTAALPTDARAFLNRHCVECHDPDTKEGSLDLTTLAFVPADAKSAAAWVKVHDRVAAGEMPPPKKAKTPLADADRSAFLSPLAATLTAADDERAAREGRATQRRLNRYEYENAVRDLLHAPWLQIRDTLPEDGEANRFNKVGDALDVSHVQLARYLNVADYALQQVMPAGPDRPATKTVRYHARDQRAFTGPMKFTVFNTAPERATFPVLGYDPQPDVRAGKAPITAGEADPEARDREAVGVVASTYEPLEIRFNRFKAPSAGHYKLRFRTYSVWVGPGKPDGPDKPGKWWRPDLDSVAKGRRSEPVTVYAETEPRLLRRVGAFDAQPDPGVAEIDTYLLAGETIRPDAARLFRSRPPNWRNPLAEKDGCPGVAFAWLEVEGPIFADGWPTAGQTALFGDLPVKAAGNGSANPAVDGVGAPIEVVTADPAKDADRLLRAFLAKAYRRPAAEADVARFRKVVDGVLASGGAFADAMTAGYTAVLCSPGFVCVEELPGKLDDYALATRLSLFLWNSPPDDALRDLAARGELHPPAVLAKQVDRLLDDPRSARFVEAFLDYWLDLRKVNNTSPDETLYPDYYLDDLLTESAAEETRLFFAELVKANRPARDLVTADFAVLNERLATHYGLPPVEGVAVRKVQLPPGSPRGGLLTQASVLKVTANGTTTSPVVRGAWVMERILGMPPPPPPPSVPAVEPDVRGATTIRQQLEQHRSLASCSACHAKIDPAGFALESFDVMGGWRDSYRALGTGSAAQAGAGAPAKSEVPGGSDKDRKPAAGVKPQDIAKAEKGASGDKNAKAEKDAWGNAAPVMPAQATPGIGKNGQRFTFHAGPMVDPSGKLPDARAFHDVVELKQALAADERQLARNLVRQLVVYGTGAPIRFGDRARVEAVLDRTAGGHYGVRALIHQIVASDLFLNK